MQKVKIFK